jgi:uncharacterized membrane protein YbaN (DUF454 family)
MTLFCVDSQSQRSWQETVHQTKAVGTLISVIEQKSTMSEDNKLRLIVVCPLQILFPSNLQW